MSEWTPILALGLRVGPIRRFLGRMRWPRPEHVDRLTRDPTLAYIRAIGLEADAKAAQAAYKDFELRAPGTDDEPWTVPEPDPPADRRSWALAVLLVALVVVAIVWRR